MSVRQSLEQLLRSAAYRDRGEGVYEAVENRRTIALIESSPHPAQWPARLETALRDDSLRIAPTWSRYVILIVNSLRTPELAVAAAAFCRDVSKCRRLVAFADQAGEEVVPFLGLPAVPGGSGTPGYEPEAAVERILVVPELAAAFLNTLLTVPDVQRLAESFENRSPKD